LHLLAGCSGSAREGVANVVGHSDIRLTQNLYQHVFEPAKRDAENKMDAILNPVATTIATKTGSSGVN
jgi:hypothetical protein